MAFRVDANFKSNLKTKFVRDHKYLALIRQLPCCITKNGVGVEAAHIKYIDLANYPTKQACGFALKPGDDWVLPLSHEMHRTGPLAQHNTGLEEDWWACNGFDPLALCEALYNDGDYSLIDMKATMHDHFVKNSFLFKG